jgi:hypothetical protein
MARRPSIIRTVKLTTTIPEDIHAKLSLFLFSELEGRIPPGAFQAFITARTREYFEEARLDLAPYVGSNSGDFIIHGLPGAIDILERKLQCTTL